MLGPIKKLYLWFIPPKFQKKQNDITWSEDSRKFHLVVGFYIASCVLVTFMYFLRRTLEPQGDHSNLWLLPLAVVVNAISLMLIRYFKNYRIGVVITLTMISIVLPLRIIHTGGISSSVTLWYALLPLIAGLAMSTRAVIVITIISALATCVLTFHDFFGIVIEPKNTKDNVHLLVINILLFLVAAMVALYEDQRKKYIYMITVKSKDLSLEKANTDRLNRLLNTMVNSLGQGFLIFDHTGTCLSAYTKACVDLLEAVPPGMKIWDILKLNRQETQLFRQWLNLNIKGEHDFYNLHSLAPLEYAHSQGKSIKLQYFPVHQDGKLDSIVLVATDATREAFAREEAQKEKAQAGLILKMSKYGHLFIRFDQTMNELLKKFEREVNMDSCNTQFLLGIMHTIKGGAGSLSMRDVALKAHEIENLIKNLSNDIDQHPDYFKSLIKNAIQDLKMKYQNIKSEYESLIGHKFFDESFYKKISVQKLRTFSEMLDKKTDPAELKNHFMNTFLLDSIGEHFIQYNEVVQKLATDLYKELHPIQFYGSELMIESRRYFQLFETLTHAFRNSVDHGIEYPHIREKAGKDPKGQISVYFEKFDRENKDWLRITIHDDGEGIDVEKIKQKFISQSKRYMIENKTDHEIMQLIFESEFTTKQDANEVSGRGIGISTILNEAKNLQGTAYVNSTLHENSELIVEVPLISTRQPLQSVS